MRGEPAPTGPAQVGRPGKPTSSLRCLKRYSSEYFLSRGEGYKLTSKPNEEDVEVCILIRVSVFDADYFQELHSQASRGFFQVLRQVPRAESRCQQE